MTKRETRVVNAFLECVKSKEFSIDYATILIEDTQKYGWLSDKAKDYFYEELDKISFEEPIVEMPIIDESFMTDTTDTTDTVVEDKPEPTVEDFLNGVVYNG